MTAPNQLLTVQQGDDEWKCLIARFNRASTVPVHFHTRVNDPETVAARKDAHERMMTALRRLDERQAA